MRRAALARWSQCLAITLVLKRSRISSAMRALYLVGYGRGSAGFLIPSNVCFLTLRFSQEFLNRFRIIEITTPCYHRKSVRHPRPIFSEWRASSARLYGMKFYTGSRPACHRTCVIDNLAKTKHFFVHDGTYLAPW